MKRKRNIFLVMAILCGVFLLSKISLADQDHRVQVDIGEKYLLEFVSALKAGDEELAASLFDETKIEKSEHPFKQLIEFWDGREITEYSKISESKLEADDKYPARTQYEYNIRGGQDTFLAKFALYSDDGEIKIVFFEFEFESLGGVRTWRQYNFGQWLITIVGIVEIIFSVYVMIVCFRNEEKNRFLWCLFILFVYGGIYLANIDGDCKVGAYVHILKFPQLLIYPTIGWQLKVSLPIGAIMYFIKVKRMKSPNIDG